MSMNELERKVSELRELRRMADELAAEVAATEPPGQQGSEGSRPRSVGAVQQDHHFPPLCCGVRKAPYLSSRPNT